MRLVTEEEINASDIVLVKIGGSILNKKAKLNHTDFQLREVSVSSHIHKFIIICGGGENANFIRYADERLKLGDDLAHWIAILAMDFNTRTIFKKLNKKHGQYQFAEDFKTLKSHIESEKASSITFFSPFKYLYEKDELPHSWDVTSDSIALYISNKLNLDKVYLIKDVDGIYKKYDEKRPIKIISIKEYKKLKEEDQLATLKLDSDNLKKSSPIDDYILTLIDKYQTSCIILNGAPPNNRIIDYFQSGFLNEDPRFKKSVFTEIKSFK